MKAINGLFGISVVVLGLSGCAEPVNEVAKPEVVAPVAEESEKVEKVEKKVAKVPAVKAVKAGEITVVDLNRLLQLQGDGKAYVIDVRPRLFYGLGHLPGAISMSRKSFPRSLTKNQTGIDGAVSGGKTLVLYCQNTECPDAYAVGKEMAAMGYSVSVYEGGWEQWKEMGF